MKTESFESLMRRVMDAYNKHPKGWNVLADPKGNVLILGRKEGYRMKLIPLNPYEHTGVGVRIKVGEELRGLLTDAPSYGFRPLPPTVMQALVREAGRGTVSNALAKRLLSIQPRPSWNVRDEDTMAVLRGPVISHPDLSAISKGQRELDAKLAKAGNELFRRRHPQRAALYA